MRALELLLTWLHVAGFRARRASRGRRTAGVARQHPTWCGQRCVVTIAHDGDLEVREVTHTVDVDTVGGHTVFVMRMDEVDRRGRLLTTHEALGIDPSSEPVLTAPEATRLAAAVVEAVRLLPTADLSTVRHDPPLAGPGSSSRDRGR